VDVDDDDDEKDVDAAVSDAASTSFISCRVTFDRSRDVPHAST